ncbi:MAG: hypothetical protein IJE81_04950 [Oscillospiraceae bacterium]|nr:hypothetical protein [Oscillospiraceae bacterium]
MRKVLITLIVIISLILAAMIGFIVFETTHVFVDDVPYFKFADTLDLREKEVSESHYLRVQDQLPGAQILWNVPFQDGLVSSDTVEITVEDLTAEDVRVLSTYFPGLQTIHAESCRKYALLSELVYKMPDCQVLYQISLGSGSADPKATELTLQADQYDYDTMMENLVYLSQLKSLHLPQTSLTVSQMEELTAAYPDVAVNCTVEILGKEYDTSTTVLDLSAMTSGEVEAVTEKLAMLPALTEIQLMNSTGSNLTLEDVSALNEALPGVLLHYSFDFYGVAVATTDEEVIVKGITVDDDNFQEKLRLTLSVLENCDRFVLDCRGPYDKLWKHIDNETLAQIREEYRDQTKLVWRIYFGEGGSSLTDAEVIRAVYGLVDDNSSALQYLEDCRYMDIGHNEHLDYCDFVSGMTSLEAVIISGAPIKSLEPFANCKELKFLELVECHYVPDLEPLRECTQLEMVNISHTDISDISPLEELNLTHLNTINNDIPEEVIEAYAEAHPDCWVVTEGNHYGVGWRYDQDGIALLDWYAKLDAEYHYISQRNVPNNIGWYLPDEA